ncbi:MAG: glycosyltransferase family 4 protein [Candidatus Caldarchaeum sp.]
MPKTILIISALDIWSMGKDKGAPSLWRTLKGYADQGWQVYFITGTNDPDSANAVHPNIRISRFDAHWLKKLMCIKKVGFFARALWWMWFQIVAFIKAQRIGAKNQIDVVYGYEVSAVPVAKVLSRLWHVPMVSRFQGSILRVAWMNKRLWKIRAWEHVLGLKIPADLVIMANDGTQGDRVLQQLGVDMNHVRFWMNGLDWDIFKNLPSKQEAREGLNLGDKKILLTVSRLDTWKRVDRSIQALPEVLKHFPDAMLVIVGDGRERERLERLVCELNVERNVRFEGAVPHYKVPQYLAAADIFLSLYDWSNVGNPLLEAMMAGKCIITLNNGDTGQFIQDERSGILLEYDELPALPHVIRRLLADEELRNRLGENARKFAEENFWSWEERMEAEVQAVEALLR